MSKQSIKATIDANIKQNGVQAITGQIMNSVLNQMVDNLAEEASTTEKLSELDEKSKSMFVVSDNEHINDILTSIYWLNGNLPKNVRIWQYHVYFYSDDFSNIVYYINLTDGDYIESKELNIYRIKDYATRANIHGYAICLVDGIGENTLSGAVSAYNTFMNDNIINEYLAKKTETRIDSEISKVSDNPAFNAILTELYWIGDNLPRTARMWSTNIYFYSDNFNTIVGQIALADTAFVEDADRKIYKIYSENKIVGYAVCLSDEGVGQTTIDGTIWANNIKEKTLPNYILSKVKDVNTIYNANWDVPSEMGTYFFDNVFVNIHRGDVLVSRNESDINLYVNLYDEYGSNYDYILVRAKSTISKRVDRLTPKIQVNGVTGHHIRMVVDMVSSYKERVDGITHPLPQTKNVIAPIKIEAFDDGTLIFDSDTLANGDFRKPMPGLGLDVVYNPIDGLYYLFHGCWSNNAHRIGYATSADLENWVFNDSPILEPNPTDPSPDHGGMSCPQIVKFADKWLMFYCALSEAGFEDGIHSVCIAESSDLVNWTRKGVVLECTDFPQYKGEDISVIYRPRVRCFNGMYYMFINAGVGDAAEDGPSENIFVAISNNPYEGWKVLGLALDSEKYYPNASYKIIADPDVIYDGKNYFMITHGTAGIALWSSDNNNFPMNWNCLGTTGIPAVRPTFAVKDNHLYVFANGGEGHTTIKIFKAKIVE